MQALVSLVLSSVAVFVTGYILPGVHIANFLTAVVVAVVLGFVNAFIRPILLILTLPLTILTLGLFSLVIIAGMVLLVSAIVPGFHVDGFWWALVFAIVLAIINSFVHAFGPSERNY